MTSQVPNARLAVTKRLVGVSVAADYSAYSSTAQCIFVPFDLSRKRPSPPTIGSHCNRNLHGDFRDSVGSVVEATCQVKPSQSDRSHLLLRFSCGAWASECRRKPRARMIVLLHRTPTRRREATGTITRIERKGANAGSYGHWMGRRDTRLREVNLQRRRPHTPVQPKSLRLRRPLLTRRRTPAVMPRPRHRLRHSRRLRAARQRANLPGNIVRNKIRRRQLQARPLRRKACGPSPALRRLQRRPPPQSYGQIPPSLRRSRRRSPIRFRTMRARTRSELPWTLGRPKLLRALFEAVRRPSAPPKWRSRLRGRLCRHHLSSRLG